MRFSALKLSILFVVALIAMPKASVNAQATQAADAPGPAGPQRPNILFIITDQQHAEMMSCAGNKLLATPAMDSLAREGIRFENAYVTNPVCVPSRISMATGVMAGRFGVLNNGMRATLPEEVTRASLGRLFKAAGYDTFYGGKTHMSPELEPRQAGYDEYFPDQREALPGACIEFIERKRDRPFLAVTSFINPHDICFAYSAYAGKSPKGPSSVEHLYQQAKKLPVAQLPPLPDNFRVPELEPEAIELNAKTTATTPSGIMRKTYDEREWRMYRWIYCRLTEQVDEHIGRILDALHRNDLERKTLVIFTSDHGDMDACHRLASKGTFYEQSVRVPLLLRYTGQIAAGQTDRHLVSSGLDVLPTLCDYCGIDIPNHVQGMSLRPLAESQTDEAWRQFVVTENQTGRMLRSQHFKYCLYRDGQLRESLVDLRHDPGELNNLATDRAYHATLDEHRRLLQQWIDSTDDTDARSWKLTAAATRK